MINAPLAYYQADYLHAVKCLKEIADVSPNHYDIERYVNNSISCLRFFPTLKVTEDRLIVRMRPEWHKDEEEQYSYPHNKELVGMGRANLPQEPMFYGSITDVSTDVFSASRISAMEIADKAFENGHCKMHVTMSAWRVKKTLLVFPVIHHSLYNDLSKESNQLVSKLRSGYEKGREEWGREETIDDLTLQINDDIYKFWSEEFQKHIIDGNYQRTAYFTEIMLNEQHEWSKERKIYDGILYPSHKAYGRLGCNIAIRPDVVDSQLELVAKIRGTLYVNQLSKKTKRLLQPEIDMVKLNGQWRQEQVPYNEEELCNELSIKNVDELELIK